MSEDENTQETAEETIVEVAPGTMVMCDDGVERPVVTRDVAIEAGVNRYFTGLPCQNDHTVERKVKGYVCTTCARNRQKLRHKKKLASDPDYKARIAAKRIAKHKARYHSDPEYRQNILDKAKARRQRRAAEKIAAMEAEQDQEIEQSQAAA